MDKAVSEVKASVSSVDAKVQSQTDKLDQLSGKMDQILASLNKPSEVVPPSPSFKEQDRQALSELDSKMALILNSQTRLRMQFATLCKGVSDCLATQSWEPLKVMQQTVEAYSSMPSEIPKGGRSSVSVPIGILSSTQEIIEATKKQAEQAQAQGEQNSEI